MARSRMEEEQNLARRPPFLWVSELCLPTEEGHQQELSEESTEDWIPTR